MYAKIIGGAVVTYPYTYANAKADYPDASLPSNLAEVDLSDFHIYPVAASSQPAYDPVTQSVTEIPPVQVAGVWTQQWSSVYLPEVTAQVNRAQAESQRIASLWNAAHDKEYNAISGSAIGLITMGVLSGKPKCLAVQAWIKSIWTIYYTRKATGSADTDYSAAGDCPHTVPELMAELGFN